MVSLMPGFHSSLWQTPKDALCSLCFRGFKKASFSYLEIIRLSSCYDFKNIITIHFSHLNPLTPWNTFLYMAWHGRKSLTNGNWSQRYRTNWGHLNSSGASEMRQRTRETSSDSATETGEDYPTNTGLTMVNRTPLPCASVWRGSGICTGLSTVLDKYLRYFT